MFSKLLLLIAVSLSLCGFASAGALDKDPVGLAVVEMADNHAFQADYSPDLDGENVAVSDAVGLQAACSAQPHLSLVSRLQYQSALAHFIRAPPAAF